MSEQRPAESSPELPAAGSGVMPASTRAYLTHESLLPLWAAARRRLEGNGMRPAGALQTTLDAEGAERMTGLMGRRVRPGATIQLRDLDAALRRSAAGAGLVAVLTDLTGPLQDRKAGRSQEAAARAAATAQLEAALVSAGLAQAPWVPQFVDGVRSAGLLTKAGTAAEAAIRDTGTVLTELAATGSLGALTDGEQGDSVEVAASRTWGLAELASRCVGDAHGLDRGRVTASLVVRAVAAALGVDVPDTARDIRELWARVGVTTDEVSGTVLVWNLRPPGEDAWSVMMRGRADLGLVTHLTVHEMRQVGRAALTAAGEMVSVCENPQVLQAAAAAGAAGTLVCTSGNPATVGWRMLEVLRLGGAVVRYHGDFDWNGVAIAGRVFSAGARPWRFDAQDYREAVDSAPSDARLPLGGRPRETPWDPDLALAMSRTGVAVHEESMLEVLVRDLQ